GNDLEVNVLKGKKLTNIRTHAKDEAVRLIPPIQMTLEKALAYIADDELVEVTPTAIRLRKKLLDPNDRRKEERRKEAERVGCTTRPTVAPAQAGPNTHRLWNMGPRLRGDDSWTIRIGHDSGAHPSPDSSRAERQPSTFRRRCVSPLQHSLGREHISIFR